MAESRYRGVKITTQQTPSGRWLAHSGYGDATESTEAAAIASVRRVIDRETGAAAKRDKDQAAKADAKRARQKQYRVTFTDGRSVSVRAENEQQARVRARNERFGRKRDRFGPEPRPDRIEQT